MSNLLNDIQLSNFLFLNDHPDKNFERIRKILDDSKNNGENIDVYNTIKNTFFSSKNIDIIQRWLIKEVYYQSKKKLIISYQNPLRLYQVMSDILQEYGQFLPFKIKEQIFELNSKVINKVSAVILEAAIGQINLIRDQNTYTTIPRPEFVNVKGSRILPSVLIS